MGLISTCGCPTPSFSWFSPPNHLTWFRATQETNLQACLWGRFYIGLTGREGPPWLWMPPFCGILNWIRRKSELSTSVHLSSASGLQMQCEQLARSPAASIFSPPCTVPWTVSYNSRSLLKLICVHFFTAAEVTDMQVNCNSSTRCESFLCGSSEESGFTTPSCLHSNQGKKAASETLSQ